MMRARNYLALLMGMAFWETVACQAPRTRDLSPPSTAAQTDGGSHSPVPDSGIPNQGQRETPFITDRVVEVRLELSAETWADIIANARAEEYHSGHLVYDGKRVENVAIRVKGNSSLNAVAGTASHRFSFKVDTNRYVEDQDLMGEKKLNFNNGFKDPSLMREHLAYQMFHAIGLPASRSSFVDLYVAGEHLGLYTMLEQVDGNFLDEHFITGEGDLYKPENPSGSLEHRGSNIGNYRGAELKRNEESSDHSAFLNFIDVLKNGSKDDLSKVLDVDSFLKYLAINTLLVNLDSYIGSGHNYYLYEEGGRFTVIPWDLNEAFGNFPCSCDRSKIIDYKIDEPTCGQVSRRPLVDRVLAEADWKSQYHEYLRDFIVAYFTEAKMSMQIAQTADLIRPFVQADTTKFFPTQAFETNLQTDISGGRGSGAIGLMAFVRERRAALLSQLNASSSATADGEGSCGGMGGPGMMGGGRPPCGDGVCDMFEMRNPEVCPRDCEDRPDDYDWCGDGICDALERYEASCPEDCGP